MAFMKGIWSPLLTPVTKKRILFFFPPPRWTHILYDLGQTWRHVEQPRDAAKDVTNDNLGVPRDVQRVTGQQGSAHTPSICMVPTPTTKQSRGSSSNQEPGKGQPGEEGKDSAPGEAWTLEALHKT